MRTKLALLLLFVVHLCISQTAPPMKIAGTFTPITTGEDPNLNPDWDWINGDVQPDGYPRYVIYFQDQPRPGEEWQYLPPWKQSDSWPGLLDRFKEDGWILLARDFGSPTRRIGVNGSVYFALYNKYRSVLRVFFLIRKAQQNFQYAMMTLTWREPDSKITGSLTSLASYCEALDKVVNTKNNATMTVLSADPLVDNWVYADFPLALDNLYQATTTSNPPSLLIKVTGITDVALQMVTEGFGAEGDADFIKSYMTGNSLGSVNFSMNRFNLPSLGIKNFNIGKSQLSGTQVDWNAVREFFKNIKFRIPDVEIGNPFKTLFDGFKLKLDDLSNAIPFQISGIDLMGLYNYFTGGGMKVNYVQTAPTYTSFQTYAQGSLTSTSSLGTITIPMPATRTNFKESFEGGEIGLVRNEPVGILALTKTPLVYSKPFFIYEIIPPKPDCGPRGTPCPGAKIPHAMNELEIAEIPQIALNQFTALNLIDCEVSLVAPVTRNSTTQFRVDWMISKATMLNDQRHLIDFESPIDESSGYFRSLPAPILFSKGRNLQIPSTISVSEVKLKIKATLQRKDDPNAQPVVFIATYNVNVAERNDLSTQQVLPTIPPQNVICTIPATGGVRVSWDRNREKNIKYYAVERSINGGTYYQIGTTSDTAFIDSEVEKAVKVYEANRHNVTVYYRVRALSEWKDDDGTVKSQFSAYSQVTDIYGSIKYLSPEKKDNSSIIPESNYLSQNFPNPFNPTTTIYYSVREPSIVTIKIFNTLGQEITTLVNDRKDIGYHYAEWNASNYPSGVYYYRITNGTFSETKRMVLAK